FDLCLRQRKIISQTLPKDLDEKVMLFHSFIIKQRKIHNCDLGDIENVDETPMTFDLPKQQNCSKFGKQNYLPQNHGK
ncbi:hypothetical protein JRQ81_019006, partial [Phrynocephalus forsythii]